MVVKFSSSFDEREKRFQFRKGVQARVKISHSTFGIIKALTRDISDSGVFVILKHRLKLPVGAHIKMQFLESERPDIAFNMKVVRETDEGIALSFVDFELDGDRFKMVELRKHWAPRRRH